MPFSAVRPAWMRKETAKAEFAATGEDFRGQKSVRIGMMLQEENSPVAERRIWSYFPAAVSGRENASMKNRITPESIVRISRIEVDPARLPEYLALVAECGRESMAKESGVYMMYSMQEKAHPERITILEIYADRAAYEHHIQAPHFQKYKRTTLEMVEKLKLLDQNPLVPEMKMK